MDWHLKALKQYADFSGRAQRAEYWFFVLFNIVIGLILGFIDSFIGTFNIVTGIGLLEGIYNLAILIPFIAVSVRRLHDIGRTGWWLLILLIPVIGFIVLFIFFVQDSNPGENQYGDNPKRENYEFPR